ncbi:MAG: arginine deiminase family protein, partial [Defluviitaleaceae bacterium]|nr:arginine deiminase family protein [Defluviitaleaceae bacterium]
MSKAINVKSEVGRLDKVLLHRPGSELERITPDNREDMLVEDVLFLTNARKEHDAFAKTLQERGIEVVYLAELTASALATSDDAKFGFIDDLINQSGVFEGKYRGELVEHMHNLACGEVIDIAMAGLTVEEFGFGAGGLSRHMGRGESPFIIHPMPNLYFTRDPFCSIGNGVAISHMWSQVRNRETIFGKYI